MVTFVTWLISRIESLVRNLLYKDIFVEVLFRGLSGDRESSRRLPNTSTFVPSDRSQCLAHHAVRLRSLPRRWPRGATNPVQLHWNCATFPSLIPGKMTVFDKTDSLQWIHYYRNGSQGLWHLSNCFNVSTIFVFAFIHKWMWIVYIKEYW